jgi:hypothetical protein
LLQTARLHAASGGHHADALDDRVAAGRQLGQEEDERRRRPHDDEEEQNPPHDVRDAHP